MTVVVVVAASLSLAPVGPVCASSRAAPCPAADQQCLQWYDPQVLPPGDPKLAYGVCGVPS